MKIILKSKKDNYICTLAIGKKYKKNWEKYSKSNWLRYCKKHNIGLIVFFENLINKDNKNWKKPNWQKFLIGSEIKKNKLKVKNICFLDIDILINYASAPNIFDLHNINKITVVSQRNIYGMNLDFLHKQISFNRNLYYSKKYPLDSAIFMSPKQIFEYHKFKISRIKDDYFCTGLYIYNLNKFDDFFHSIFFKYSKEFHTLTLGEEPVLNYELQRLNKINVLDYKFQALWLYEMASKYTFLYDPKMNNDILIKRCIENSLISNYFLHFAGSWGESEYWKLSNKNGEILKSPRVKKFVKYLDKKIYGKPKGKILPKND